MLDNVLDQLAAGNRTICAVMIESNLEDGNQPLGEDPSQLRYGVSITDKCIGWDDNRTSAAPCPPATKGKRRAEGRVKSLRLHNQKQSRER